MQTRCISKPTVIKSVKGEDIQLTIDATIQFFAYKYLVISKIKQTRYYLGQSKGEVMAAILLITQITLKRKFKQHW